MFDVHGQRQCHKLENDSWDPLSLYFTWSGTKIDKEGSPASAPNSQLVITVINIVQKANQLVVWEVDMAHSVHQTPICQTIIALVKAPSLKRVTSKNLYWA